MPVLLTRELSVRYGSVRALAPLTVNLPEGAWALLGPNGAGKSTLIRAMLGLTRAAGGGVSVLGLNPYTESAALRCQVGYMPESPAIIPGLTGVRYVTLAARLNGLDRVSARRAAHVALDECGLGEARYRKVETYSTGMRQRVKLAQAIAHDPKLLILDEPTNGLDPEGRDQLLDLIKDLTKDGRSLILSSHILHEVRRVCPNALILRGGQVVHQGPLASLATELGGVIVETIEQPQPLIDALVEAGLRHEMDGDRILIHGNVRAPELLRLAHRSGVAVRSVKPHQRAVHDVVVELLEGKAA